MEVSHYKIQKLDEVSYNPALLPKGLHPKAKPKKIYQGFPSLKSKTFEVSTPIRFYFLLKKYRQFVNLSSILFQSTICKADVKVFEFVAREESLILSFEEQEEEENGLSIAKRVLGKTVWVNWPHLESALVSAVYTRKGKFILGRDSLVIKGKYK